MNRRTRSASGALAAAAPRKATARGGALLEALVSVVVLAVGLLGLTVSQARLLADVRSNGHRAVAISLTEDLGNRILANRERAFAGAYNAAWGGVPEANTCGTAACDAEARAQYDLRMWMLAVQASLPEGKAAVFLSAKDPRQVGIAVSWRASESGTLRADRTDRLDLLNTSFNANGDEFANGADLTCPANQQCLLTYVEP